MSDAPPQLGEIQKTSEFRLPTLSSTQQPTTDSTEPLSGATAMDESTSSNAAATFENAKATVISTAQSAMDTVANHPITQNVTETVTNGPVAQTVKDQSAKTSAEASKLAATRKTPGTQTATGQPLTHYHSFFYSLLAWEQPRVTAISFATIITTIFIFRYVPVLRLAFKLLAYSLGFTALIEGAGQLLLSQSIVSAIRPRRYFTIPRETLESVLGDVEQLLNFFVIESQRLLFAEDASKTFVAFLASFIAYWLIKFTPVWGLSLIAVTTIYFVPLVYITNKELIDEQLNEMSKIVNAQTAQMKDLAAQHTAQATESLKSYTGDLSKQASEYIGSARRSISPAAHKVAAKLPEFPTAPKQEPAVGVVDTADQEDDVPTKIAVGVPAS